MKKLNEEDVELKLEGLSGLTYDKCKQFYNEIDLDLIINGDTKQVIFPVIRYITSKVIFSGTPEAKNENNKRPVNYCITDEYCGVTSSKVLNLINTNDIVKTLETAMTEFFPISNKYFTSIDAQAELTVLFCDDYIMSLVNKIVQSNK